MTPHFLDVLTGEDLERAFREAAKERAEAILVLVSGAIRSPRGKQIADLAVKVRLPVMHERTEHVEAGGLISYGVHLPDLGRRAAVYVYNSQRRQKPADLRSSSRPSSSW